MASMKIKFSGDGNRAPQVGSNSGHVHFHSYGPPGEGPRMKPEPSSTVPFRRDLDFVDRDILIEVDKICSKPAARAALVGLGGVGKSQLAIEYSYRVREEFPQTWVFWVHASNAARFEEGYRIIADRIELPRKDDPTANILALVSRWLSDEANGRWIIILDNADDSSVFSDLRKGGTKSDVGAAVSLSTFLPQTSNGSILVTSRSGDAALRLTGSHHDIIKVEPMDKDRALLLFKKKLQHGFDITDDAKELLQALDYMPLAISQAAAYISQRAPRTTVAKYLDKFRKSDKNQTNLLNKDTGDLRRDGSASNSIITTWQISFEYLRGKRPSAARLLSLMSFFDRQGIPEFLLHCYHDRVDGSNLFDDSFDVDLEDSDMTFEEDIFTLTSYSLIKANIKNDQFEMHRLVQFSTRKWLELNCELEKWKERYIEILWKAFPTENYDNWTTCQVLFPHAEAILAHRPTEKKCLMCWSGVLDKAGGYAATQGNFLTAEEMTRQALEKREEVLGKKHLITLANVNNLGLVLHSQGKYEAAEAMNRRALNGREKTLGKEHLDTLISVGNLAVVLQSQGKYEAAEEMSRRALDGHEKTLGKEHSHTLTSVNNLGLVLQSQGKYEAAEEMKRRALDGREKTLGKEHPHTLTSVNNLGLVLRSQGKYEAAEAMNRRALDGREKTLGKEHLDTLISVGNLASVLQSQGKYEAAEAMNRRALEGHEKTLGNEHPHTLISVGNLASVLRYQEKYEAAEKMNRRALDGHEKTLGKEHPHTLTSVNNLASVLQSQGKYEAAEAMNGRALDGKEKALGKEHPHTLMSVHNLAFVLQSQGKYEAAEAMNRRALDGREKTLGKEHPDTLASIYLLASLLHGQKRYRDATPLYERSRAGYQRILGTNHPTTLACSDNYASMIEAMRADGGSTLFPRKRRRKGHSASVFKPGYRPTFPEKYF